LSSSGTPRRCKTLLYLLLVPFFPSCLLQPLSSTLMVTFPFRLLSAAVLASQLLNHVACVPIEGVTPSRNASLVELETSATAAAPHWVIYSDQWVSGENGPPDPSVVKVCARPAVVVRRGTFLIPLRRVSTHCEFSQTRNVPGECLTRVAKYYLILVDLWGCRPGPRMAVHFGV